MPPRFKVLLYEPMHEAGTRLLAKKCELLYARTLEENHLISLCREADAIIIRANGRVSEAILSAAPRLKVVGRHGAGLDCIDLEAARKRGIRVVYTPNANTESVAEHFVALSLMLARKIRLADTALRRGNWHARHELIGVELRGKTLGVLGFGRIGQQTARICHWGFGMPVLYYDIASYPDVEAELGARRMKPEEVVSLADFISVNLPLLPETRGLVDAALIRHIKPTAFLINMARGPIWKEKDVVEALKEGRIAGVGSDVYEVEPAPQDNPLFSMDGFVGTPHMSAHTEEGLIHMSLVAEDVIAVLEGREPRYPADEAIG